MISAMALLCAALTHDNVEGWYRHLFDNVLTGDHTAQVGNGNVKLCWNFCLYAAYQRDRVISDT